MEQSAGTVRTVVLDPVSALEDLVEEAVAAFALALLEGWLVEVGLTTRTVGNWLVFMGAVALIWIVTSTLLNR